MDFLLSEAGMIYNLPALAVLGLLLWKRPIIGFVMTGLAGLRVLWPLLGGQMIIPFSVHAALVFVTMFAWTRDDWVGNALLFAAGVGMLFLVEMSLGWIIPMDDRAVGIGIAIGLVIAMGRAFAWGLVFLYNAVQEENPTPA